MKKIYKDKILSYISLAKKSGNLLTGFESVKACIINKKTCIVFTSYDLSNKSRKEISYVALKYETKLVNLSDISMDDLYWITSKRAGIFSIIDLGLASAILRVLDSVDNQS